MTVDEILAFKDSLGISIASTSRLSGVPVITIAKIFCRETLNPRQVTLDAIERGLRRPEAIAYSKKYGYLNSSEGAYAREILGLASPGERISEADMTADPGRYTFGTETDAVRNDSSFVYGTSAIKEELHTYEEFEALPEGARVELIDGKFYDMGAPACIHQEIVDEIHFQIRSQIRERGGECKTISGFGLELERTGPKATGLIPDFVIICDRTNLHKASFHGVPEFVLEVLSPSNRQLDLTIKLLKYQQYGAKEYWIVDLLKKRLIIYNFMNSDENPIVMPLEGKQGIAIYQNEINVDLDALREIIEEDIPD